MARNDVELICELSPMQQAMLFASLYSPGSGVYVIQVSLRLSGRLDVAAFESAWRRVVERHGVLRTGFHWEDLEKPLQVVHRAIDLGLRRESWRGLSAEEQEARLREFLDADRESGFVLSEPPLMRLALFDLGADIWHLVWSLHHLLVDGWSVGLLLKELFSFYAGEPSPPYPRSYGDYIAWLQRQDAAEAEAFWRRSLAGLTAPTLLAGSNGRGSGGFRRSQRRIVRLSAAGTAGLRELAKRHRLTLNTLVQGAWALVAAQATGGSDVVFGGTVAGRPGDLPGADSIVGLFINTLPVRVKVEPERLLLPWLEELQERQAEARRYEHAPLFEVQTWSDLPPGTALFDNILVFESYPLDSSLSGLLPDLKISGVSVNELTDYPVNLVVFPGAELSLELIHDTGRFDAPSAVRLLERLSGALRSFAADPERRLADIPFYIEAERHQALVEWNDTASRYPREACLPDLFAAVAREAPDAPALIPAEGEVWSYRRLEEAASGLAGRLRSRGVGPETRVALCMERSPELIVAVLAVLKAGGAYAPLDDGYPDERLAFLLADLEAPLVLVDQRTRQRLDGMAPLLTVEASLWSEGDAEPVRAPAESLALVLYTSGSTGRPKGVALTHRGVVRLVRETNYARWDRRDRVAHLSNISFDAATLEIWAALLHGAALAILPREEALAPDRLAARIRRDGITWTLLTTALFNQIAREQPEALAPLRTVMFGGEAADPSAVARMLGGNGPDFLNAYGPAEGATLSTWHRVREIVPGAVTVPIGLPVANTSVYVLGLWRDPAPPGVVGELFLGGDGLARGYLNRPDLTAERFVPHPWGAGERLYRTGDLVRQRSDGALEFVGRVDHQVKIRGFRIEPGEIEAVLAAHPAVAACAVLARRDPLGPVRLVAYVVLDPTDRTDRTDPSDLSAWLRQKLPSYMVPSAFVRLDALPLTPNGKVDRAALPAPEPVGSQEVEIPSDPVEELLAGIWADVLGRERVGVHHDFFELGGHSLLATQVASRIRGVLGVKLPLRCLFEAPTVAGLARLVRAGLEAEDAPPLVRVACEGDLPLSFAQQRLWFIDQLEPESPLYNLPLTLRVEGPLDGTVLAFCLGEIVRRHEALRTVFPVRGDSPVQVIRPAAPFALPVVDLSGLPETARETLPLALAGAEASRPFDLARGPLLRGLLLRLAERDHLIAVTLHHIVSDGWSLGILIREVAALYAAFAEGRPSPLSELPVQYADFAVWQSSWLRGEVLEGEIAFWRRQIAGLPPLLELPTDRPRPAVQSFRGASRPVRLPAGLTRQMESLARREGATLFMVLLAGFLALLARYSGRQDLAVGSPVAGRNRPEIAGLIGFFVNLLVLREDLSGEPTFRGLLGRVRETAWAAYSHQDLPFERLVQELAPERSFAHASLVQVILALQNAPAESLKIQDLRLQWVSGVGTAAKFDLVLSLEEHGGGLSGTVDYAVDLFDATMIDRLILHYERLLAAAVAEPERIASELPLLSAAERHQALTEWNDTRVPRSRGALLGDLFAAQAAATPEAPAAAFEGETLTYAELYARADRLARHLRRLGCGPERRVGVALERNLDLLVALLGVLGAGAVYVPLDPQLPRERLAFLQESSGLAALLRPESLRDRLHAPAGLPAVAFESSGDVGDHCLAYVLYTSGSTGRPKGAMVTHAGMINHLRAKIADLGLDRRTRLAQTASQGFDISIWQFLAPLLVGGSVHIAGQETVQDPERLLRFVARERITVLEVVPSLLGALLDALPASRGTIDLSSLQWMIVTGEACAPDLADRWLTLAPHTRLLNAYGPTECSDDVTHYERAGPEATPSAALPIGRPVANTQIHVLDPAGQPTAQGVPGELFVGGSGVGRGYLGDGGRTAQVFLPDPFAPRPGQRLYRTGDLARRRTDGQLEFLGRVDHQVKIRGHRIEPGEIESVLASRPEVQAAVVTAREDVPGQARLVAYVVPRRDEGAERDRVSEWEAIYDEVYDTGERSEHDVAVNLRVWIDSYTGAPLPDNEIVECFEDTVARILALRPSRVLEMGCGTGLLLLRIAPHCAAYTGADLSDAALRSLRDRIEERSDLPPVDLLHRAADDFTGIPPGSFDVVVVNEVAQYFPGLEYLVRVVESAVAATAPGGAVFLGGLRSFPLLEVFHTSIELARSPEDRPLGEILAVARRRAAQDKELAIDPVLFEALARSLPEVASLSIQLKGGRAHNELTRFRYDVVLRVAGGAEPPLPGEPRCVAWGEGWTLGTLRQALAEGPEVLAVRGVPNARLLAELHRSHDGEIEDGVEPADLWDLAAGSGREAEVRWSDRLDRLDVVFHRPGTRPPWPFPVERANLPWSRYTNAPDRGVPEGLVARLRAFASERLPDWMVPSAWVLLEELPVTPNGKVDRKALPPPEPQSPRESRQAPRTPVEEVLAGIWAELLGVEQVGVDDHFFDLGGHSLLATRVMSRLRGAFGVEMSLRDLFEAPLLADLATRVESARRSSAGAPVPPLVPVPREGALPLSFAQQRLWFIDQLEPGSPLYNIPAALRVEGSLQAGVLVSCLGEIVRRHEALRTVFAVQEGAPIQVIRPLAAFSLPVVDLAGLPESGRETLALHLAGEEARRPFDLSCDPSLRCVLLRLAEGEHIVGLTLHHIAGDGWSMGILVREIAALYAALTEGRPSPLPELPVQYADFAVWQRSWLQGEILEGEVSFWRRQLADLPPLLELPTDRPRPAVQSFRGASHPVRLPAGLTRQMEALARGEGATLFMVLLAGFQALLARYSGQQDLAVGTPVAGRNRTETEGLIGFFVNTLVLRGDVTGSFRELLGRVRETALAAWLHQDVPFERLVEELAPERSLARSPLFQVMFALQNAPFESLEIQGLRLEALSGIGKTAKFDLTLSLAEHDGGLTGTVEYATDLFDAVTIDRLILGYERLLAGMTGRPDRPVEEIGLLTAEEALQLAGWNATARAYPSACVYELFARQAERAPDAVAVSFGDRELTYGELDLRSRRLALRLRRLGVGPGSPVGLCAERSPEMVAGMLGILAAGGAYVPLDPVYPEERLAFLLEDSGAGVLVVQEHLVGRFPLREGLRVEMLARAETDPGPGALTPAVVSSPGDPAYVIYTSGSTGRPKGVVVPHRAIVRLVRDTDYVQLGPEDRVAQASNSSFDAATFEVWGALLNGGRLVGIEREVTLSPRDMVEALDRGGVTALFLTTVLFHQIAREEPGGFARLRYLLFGGEMVDPAAVLAVLQTGPPGHLLHVYGPTETTTFASWHRVEPAPPGAAVPIGRPLANGTLDVLDRGLHPLPPGVPGELYVGGDGLAHGYHARPELTAGRFVPHPRSGTPGARLYRTGDLVRRRPDGGIEFLGRLDHQVKIRGFRVEPGEIEAALMTLPGIREAVVVVREDCGDRRLVAYVAGDAGMAAGELRRSLRKRLPDYMVPAAFVALTALPLTPNGKVDRKALAASEPRLAEDEDTERSRLAPRTPVEEVLAGIWAGLLGRERVGRADHFFDQGGHSLLAARVVSRLREAFGVEMPLRDLFEAPVLADLAARVETALRAGEGRSLPPLVPVLREEPPPLSFAQRRLWFLDQLEPGSPLYNMPVALRVEGPLYPEALTLTLGEIVRRHEALRTVFAASKGSPVQVIRPATPFALPVVDLSGLPERTREALATALAGGEALRLFDLSRDLLLRGVLLRLAGEDHVLALTLHHIASDGWSMGVLVREVAALYTAFVEGRPSPLAELPLQYADFAVWQSSWLQGEVLDGEIAYWRRQLAGLPPLLELPTDRPRPAVQSFRGTSRPVRLPGELTRRVEALARREGATLFMILLAGFEALLARYSGQDDLAVGSPVAGRNRMEIEGLIGFFVNTLVLRGDLTGSPTFRELLARVRETALAAHTHQDLPFERLVEELAPERSLAHAPLFQVMLALQNAPVGSLEIRDLRLRPLAETAQARTTAKFDLTLTLEEHGGELVGAVEYASDLFDSTTIGRLCGHFEQLLAGLTEEPERRTEEAGLLTAGEALQLAGWNCTARACPQSPVHELFARQAERAPDAVAVAFGERELTYGELHLWSWRLARRLRLLGVGPGSLVGLCAERSPEMVAGMLGILAAGGAYVPLDPGDPEERLAFLLEDLLEDRGAGVLVAQEHLAGRLPARKGLRVEILDRAEGDSRPGLPPLVNVSSPGDPAYVLYTSGSTGRPKGVVVPHGAIVRLVRGTDYVQLGPEDRVAQAANSSFDAATFEIWGALLQGARLVGIEREVTLSPSDLAAMLDRGGVTALFLTTALFNQVAREEPGAFRRLRYLLFGGELVDPAAVLAVLQAGPPGHLLHVYGPTETTTFASWHRVESVAPGATVPIGRPLANGTLHVLDRGLHPLPVGVPGELYVGGGGLAHGYHARPELTAGRFVPHPLPGLPGDRLYRTGDLVRRRPDGALEFLGRLDHQVKIRGFRVEPGEIETALLALPGVREAVVVAREDRPGDRRLVAYVTGDVAAGALRGPLSQRLPDYLVPAAFVVLAALPLTPNGKVDRKELPAPDRRGDESAYVPPADELEERLAGIWREVLRLDRVGVHDNFFAVGGHSLLATQVVTRVREVLGVPLPLRRVYEEPTIRRLARSLGTEPPDGKSAPPACAAVTVGGGVLHLREECLAPGGPAPQLAVRLSGELSVEALERSFAEILRGREAQLAVFDLSDAPEDAREEWARQLALDEARHPFDAEGGPWSLLSLLRLDEREHLCLVTLHPRLSGGRLSGGLSVRELVDGIGNLYSTFAGIESE